MRVIRIAALALAAAVAGTARAAVSQETLDGKVSSFEDIRYWIGEGTNRCAMVVDFNDGSTEKSSFVWGYRWNGEAASVADIMRKIAADDPNFTANITAAGWVQGFTYDFDEDGQVDFAPESWYEYDYSEYDDEEIDEPTVYVVGDDWAASYATGTDFSTLEWTKSWSVASEMYPQNGQWFAQKFATYAMDMADWSYVIDEYEPATVAFSPERYLHMGDIKYWFGSGTNQCAMVVDFNDGSVANSSFVWGYRWNGTAPSVETILKTIAAGDSRFTANISSGWVKGFTYDLDDDGEADLVPESWYEYDLSEYDDDEIEEPTGYVVGDDWAASYATGELFHNLVWTKSAATANGMYPQNGQWFVQRFASYAMEMTGWSYVLDDYETTVVPSLAEPAPTLMAALPTVDGQFVATLADAFETARGGKAVLLPASGTVDPATKTITIGTAADETEQTFTVPAHFDMSVSGQAVTLALNQTAAPTLGTNADSELPPLTVTDTCVTIVPGNVIDGLYYGLSTASSLTKGFSKPTQWIRAEGGTVVLQAEKNAAAKAGFYKVCVSDVDEAAR